MRRYVRKTELIDKERGDMLSLRRQDVEALYSASYPAETRRDILDALIGWFAGGDAPKLENPLADAFLQTFVSRQRESVRRYIEICRGRSPGKGETSRDKPTQAAKPDAGKSKDGAAYVETSNDEARSVTNINKSKVKINDDIKESFIFTVGERLPRTDAAAPSPLTVEEAQKAVNMIAPPADEKHYSDNDRKYYGECEEEGEWNDGEGLINYALEVIEEAKNPITRNALKKVLDEIGEPIFRRAVFRFDTDLFAERERIGSTSTQDAPDDSIAQTPGKHLLARLRRLQAALRALQAERKG